MGAAHFGDAFHAGHGFPEFGSRCLLAAAGRGRTRELRFARTRLSLTEALSAMEANTLLRNDLCRDAYARL
jgi:hypothetical protein